MRLRPAARSAGSRDAWSLLRARSARARSWATRAARPCRRRSTCGSHTAKASVPSRRRQMTTQEHALVGIDKLNIPRSDIPAVTHVDYSARVQTVHRDTNPRFHELLAAFKARTGCPVLVNTSFNVRGETIVCTPEDAVRFF